MAPQHVGLDQVHEHEARVGERAQELGRDGDPVSVRRRRPGGVHVLPREDVADLAHAVHADPALPQALEVVRARRQQREVVPVAACARTRPARRRTAARSPARRHARRRAAAAPSGRPRTAPRAAPSSSWAAIWNTLSADVYTIHAPVRWCSSPRRWMISVPEAATLPITAAAGGRRERPPGRSAGKPSGYVGNALRGDDAHHLPVARGRIHPEAALGQPAVDGRGVAPGRAARDRHDVAEPEGLHGRHVEAAHRLGDVRKRRRSRRAEVGRVGQVARPDRIQHDHACPWHRRTLPPGGGATPGGGP